ncbi:MAG: ABC transporter permease [Planctomycetes bacterium]|nr:ABC transporter permease [Planctomycetota bacterium]
MERFDAAVAIPGAWSRWRAQRGVRFALSVLALVISSAIFAPFLASARPYTLLAVDRGAYETSLAELEPLLRNWNARLLDAAAAKAALRDDDPRSVHAAWETHAALLREVRAVELRLSTLRRYASSERAAQVPLDALDLRLRGWTDKVHAGELDDLGPASEVVASAAALRNSHRPRDGSSDGMRLRERRSFPLLADLSFCEWLAALAWLAALPAFALRARARGWIALGVLAVLLASLCAAAFRAPSGLSTREVKLGVATGAIELASAWYPPIPFGPDETRMSEAARPPTWASAAEIDERGGYVRGPRAAQSTLELVPSARPVAVLPAEPSLNSPVRHLLGTDALGRDVLARVLWGGRASLAVGLLSASGVLFLGVLVGALAGYLRGAFDAFARALIAILQSFPPFFLMVTAAAIGAERAASASLQPLAWVTLVIVAVGWTGIARLVRAEALRVRELDYVRAVRALGYSQGRIFFRHVLPNVLTPALAAAAFVAISALLAESSVSFLGFGVRLPDPSWGALLQEARAGSLAWLIAAPGLSILVTCLALAWLGDAARDALDPRESR